jgi:hypothetical protein
MNNDIDPAVIDAMETGKRKTEEAVNEQCI